MIKTADLYVHVMQQSRYSHPSIVPVCRNSKSPVMLLSSACCAAGADRWQNGSDVIVDYNTSDPLIRWDSYQNICDGEGTVTLPHDTQKPSAGRPPNEAEHPGGKRHLLLSEAVIDSRLSFVFENCHKKKTRSRYKLSIFSKRWKSFSNGEIHSVLKTFLVCFFTK